MNGWGCSPVGCTQVNPDGFSHDKKLTVDSWALNISTIAILHINIFIILELPKQCLSRVKITHTVCHSRIAIGGIRLKAIRKIMINFTGIRVDRVVVQTWQTLGRKSGPTCQTLNL